jgi:exopolysaccharide production protein ExoQ
MPPIIALLFCIAFVLFLLNLERRTEPNTSIALWIPLFWMIFCGSRFPSQWFQSVGTGNVEEGSPLDMAVFLMLIIAGILFLSKKRVPWIQIIRLNFPIFLFLGYSGISCLWSDIPFVSFKRWIKEIGNLVMVLLVLSEHNPIQGIKKIFRKLGYFLIPFSIVLIKYYPEYGRGFSEWTGEGYNMGVGLNKNYLGFVCMTCGFFYVWVLSGIERNRESLEKKRIEIFIYVLFLAMVIWLFNKANSATALVSFIAGSCVAILYKLQFARRNTGAMLFSAFVLCFFLFMMNLSEWFISILGRNSSLTDRVPLWNDILSIDTNPIIGCGYNSFWSKDRAPIIWEKWAFHPNSTHNGYIDVYVNLGWIGLFFLACLIISAFRKAKYSLVNNDDYGRYKMGFLVIALLYNFTETAFVGLHLVWLTFLLVATGYPSGNVSYMRKLIHS